ncbi:MAG TPA: BtpA/SgcQ family protein, partial [Candidatus Limnocylindria bacterium]|nr:BtpA/SgcQ family protein [Candidatus Limnocylindria bacterium]
FGTAKPVIAMAHFPALPGTPRHERGTSVDELAERVRTDVGHLLAGGVDGILFCNEDDRPYSLRVGAEIPASMAAVIAEVRPTDRPFGVDILWDPMAAMALAKATGASFMREVVTGAYESDMGVWAPDAADFFRYREQLDATDVMVMANITPEFASPLGSRTVAQRARSAVVSSLVDALLIAGPMAGAEPDLSALEEAKEAVGDQVPVLMNTGAKVENIARFLQVADGVIVGSGLKVDGQTWNPVDPDRVTAFMAELRRVREAG